MKRLIILLLVINLCGCHQWDSDSGAAAPGPSPQDEIEFADWPAATDEPYLVSASFDGCLPGEPKAQEALMRKHLGPHYQPAIVVRTNPEAISDFKLGRFPLPVGTVIVKEKHLVASAEKPPVEYGAMIKREPGYDPDHGNWEYMYVTREPEKHIERGRISSCIECHDIAKDQDYLFRTYLRTVGK